jgi:hypothetical protein
LVCPDQRRNVRLKAVGENLGDALDSGVLEGNRPEVLGLPSVFFLWEEHKE